MPKPSDLLWRDRIDTVTVPQVRAFLRDAEEDEGLLWEAKADDPGALRPEPIRKAVCAFANSRDGGLIIVGAKFVAGSGWSLPGLRNPPNIPIARWLDQVIQAGVNPVPIHFIRTFKATPARGPVALVKVLPLAIKPAVTTSGGVYVRTTTQSMPLNDPVLIAALFGEGDAAREAAIRRGGQALDAAIEPRVVNSILTSFAFGYRLALSPVSVPDSFQRDVLRSAVVGTAVPNAVQVGLSRRALTAVRGQPRHDKALAWFETNIGSVLVVEVNTSGVVAAAHAVFREYEPREAIDSTATWADEFAVLRTVAQAVGLAGPASVHFRITSTAGELRMDDWSGDLSIDEDTLAFWRRQVARANGSIAPEPDL